MDFNSNLSKLREFLSQLGVDAIFVSMNNFFGNFTSTDSDIYHISGFSGSNGRAVVSKDAAILSVDGRYVKQATEQTDCNVWEIGMYPLVDSKAMIAKTLKKGQTLAIGPFSATYQTYLSISNLAKSTEINVKLIEQYPILRHQKSEDKIYFVGEDITGESIQNRIIKIQETLKPGSALLLSDKVAIGWVFGARIPPTVEKSVLPNCVAFITASGKPKLFCDLQLANNDIEFDFFDISKFEDVMQQIPKISVDMDYPNTSLYFPITLQKCDFTINQSQISYGSFESSKNTIEIRNQREAAKATSIAFIKTLAYAENTEKTTEMDVIGFFEGELKKNETFVALSFNTISAFEENTSVVHYTPKSKSNSAIEREGLFLLDGGAHISNSTTDMTRVVYRGICQNDELKSIYSIVLKSLIMFSSAKFPDKTKASSLDSIARFCIWNEGMDYPFGTGHGVGSFSNVHEPPRISSNSVERITANMVITIEPGMYFKNFGIRLENMLLTKRSFNFHEYIEFETLNFIPFCRKLIKKEVFDSSELNWINSYHEYIYKNLKQEFEYDSITLNWLKDNTLKI
ncbi:MAG: M24 family metallopeptidase [Holosporales bacterium]|jgi:Xaa-Pro aminopeptidase|nr:M24 family metallopeptidase [Holosporales bacterium]